MSTSLRTEAYYAAPQSDGGVWYQLISEREEICETLLQKASSSDQVAARYDPTQLQERLRLIDDALDRLMAGTYGDCVVCGSWIEDNKLHADPALPCCCGCQRRSEAKHVAPTAGVKVGVGGFKARRQVRASL